MWAYESVFYQIYPMGFCGAPWENDGKTVNRIEKVGDWAAHIASVGCNAVYFSPVFESDSHGYDTRDFRKIDCRLGTNKDFAEVCGKLHKEGVRIVLDGVFNHVGRGFWAFKDVQEKKWDSPYKDWFHISFDGNSNYNDGFWYEGWEGHYELVKLNLRNEEVIQHIFDCIRGWVEEFDIDGLRLDVAYSLDRDFIRRLRSFCDSLKPDFFLIGEVMSSDCSPFLADGMLHSCTNYDCYKGLYSSFNSMNMFEIGHSLQRQFGPEPWTLYKGKHLLSFVDNHDVSRIASLLEDRTNLPVIYGLLFGMPGVPAIYYGSEWGLEGRKQDGDEALRPALEKPEWNTLSDDIATFAKLHVTHPALYEGGYRNLHVWNKQLVFERACDRERVIVAVNSDDMPYFAPFDAQTGEGTNLLTGEKVSLEGGKELPAHSVSYWQV